MSEIDGLYHKFKPDYYEKNGKIYSKGYEKYGDVVNKNIPLIMNPVSGETWSVFKKINDLNDEIEKRLDQKFKDAIKSNKSIIIDMTNISNTNRKFAIDKIKNSRKDFIVKAVVFNHGGVDIEDTIIKINKKRNIELIKTGREKYVILFILVLVFVAKMVISSL